MGKNNKIKEFVVEGYVIKDNSVLLVYHKKIGMWLPPGGHIEKYETPEEALVREIKEETGLEVEIVNQVNPDKKFDVRILYQPTHIQLEDIKGTHYHIDLIYLCRVKGGKLRSNQEIEDLRFFNIEEINKLDNIPEEVKYFATKFLSSEIDKNYLKLPVLSEIISKNTTNFSSIKLLVIQHIKKNTVEFIRLLKKSNFRKIVVIAKPYSVDQEALKEIKEYAEVIVPSFEELENLEIVDSVVRKYINEEDKFICLDMGGYFSRYFQNQASSYGALLGVIEDTKNGIWFNKDKIRLKFPLLSVASSRLKVYAENYAVAKSIVRNLENILVNSNFSRSLSGNNILVLGYGGIGENIARLLKDRSLVTVYDISATKLLKARMYGFNIIGDLRDLFGFDIIIGTTGEFVLRREHLRNLKNGAILVNASTRKREFEIDSVRDLITSKIKNELYTTYKFYNGKTMHIIADGFPVNFLNTESVPSSILDLIFSEIFILMKIVTENGISPGFYPVERFYEVIEEDVSKMWLKYWT